VGDLGSGGWTVLRRSILVASAATAIATAALVALATHHNVGAASVFIVFALSSLLAWTHAAAVAARRLEPRRVYTCLALIVTATMVVMTSAAAVWFVSVTAHAPSFVGAAQLAVIATFTVAGTALAANGSLRSVRA
jgi:hypothetical protein